MTQISWHTKHLSRLYEFVQKNYGAPVNVDAIFITFGGHRFFLFVLFFKICIFTAVERKMSYGRGPPDIHGMTSLKVDNLTYRTTTEDLRRLFQKYGEIGDVYIPRDRFNRESRGFAFVRFHDRRDADDAMDTLDGSLLDGRELRVQLAKYGRPSEPNRRSSNSRSNRRR